eukprot:5701199-Amphidinium_carterae.1
MAYESQTNFGCLPAEVLSCLKRVLHMQLVTRPALCCLQAMSSITSSDIGSKARSSLHKVWTHNAMASEMSMHTMLAEEA